jgi:hypothetical protein
VLRIEQTRPRAKGEGQAFLAQVVRLPKQAGLTRTFDSSAQMRGGLKGPVTIQVYVWEPDNIARAIARRDVKVHREWRTATVNFKVPERNDQFVICFYLPRDDQPHRGGMIFASCLGCNREPRRATDAVPTIVNGHLQFVNARLKFIEWKGTRVLDLSLIVCRRELRRRLAQRPAVLQDLKSELQCGSRSLGRPGSKKEG